MNKTTNTILAAIAFFAYSISAAFASISVPSADFPDDILKHFRMKISQIDGGGYESISKNENFKMNNQITEISVIAISADITLNVIEQNELKVKISGEASKNKIPEQLINENSGKIEIVLEKSSTYGGSDLNAEINVPKGFAGQIIFSTVSSDIDYSGPKLKKLNIKTVSGDITAKDCGAESLLIRTVSGDVAGICDATTATVHTTSGDSEFNIDRISKSAIFKSVSGDLRIRGTLKDKVSLNFRSTSGDINGADFIKVDDGYGSTSADYNPASAKVNLEVRSVSGDIEVL